MAKLDIDDLRVRRILQQKKRELGSFLKLESAIAEANNMEGIDRRKLKALVEGDDVFLRISDFVRLNAYLAPFGEGLAAWPMFEQPDILAALREANGVAFLVGAYPRTQARRTDISLWDMRSLAEIESQVSCYGGSIHFEIEDVISQDHGSAVTGRNEGSERWRDWLQDDRSLVCVGSPRACRATEWQLAAMFEQKPFVPATRGEVALPFHFIWCRSKPHSPSRFSDHGESIRDREPELAATMEAGDYGVAALRAHDHLFTVRQQNDVGKRWTDYGIIAVQRRSKGGIWVALCGLSGPATYAAARVLRNFTATVPRPERVGEHGPIMWAVVEAEVELNDHPGDNRVVVSEHIHYVPRPWSPKHGREVNA